MTESFPAPNTDPATSEETNRLELLDDKIAAAWGSSVGQQGYGGPHLVAGILYESLYDQAVLQHTLPQDTRPATRIALEAPMSGVPHSLEPDAPSRPAFVKEVAETMMYGVDIESVLLPHAREQLELLHDRPSTRIIFWTAGHLGHQQAKLEGFGVTVHAEGDPFPEEQETTDGGHRILAVQAAIKGDKLTEDVFARVERLTEGRQQVVMDDRVKNLTAFLQRFPDAVALWPQQGAHAEKTLRQLADGKDQYGLQELMAQGRVVPMTEIGELASTLDGLYAQGRLDADKPLAAICDLDDTFIDNEARRLRQNEAVHELLVDQGWV